MATPIASKLSQPAQRALQGVGISSLEQLAKLTKREFESLHGIGPGAVRPLVEEMRAHGLEFAAEPPRKCVPHPRAAMVNRLPRFARHLAFELRGGFLVRPLIIALALGFTGGLLSTLEAAVPGANSFVPSWFFPSRSDPQVAQIVLGAIATSVMTVVSIVFAILLMTLTLASMQFSPRIIVTFSQDRVTQWTLGVFLGTFTYCLAALPAAHNFPQRAEPVLTVMGAMVLALVCVGWLLFFIHHISQAISVNQIVDNIARDTEAVIDMLMPHPAVFPKLTAPTTVTNPGDATPVMNTISGYIRYVDVNRLLEIAKTHRFCIRLVRRFGHLIPAGAPLVTVSKEHKLTPELEAELRSAFNIGPSRTSEQDVEYGVLQIVDIALRALSPAVNDPSTAITCVDQLSRILIYFAGREPYEYTLFDPPGVPRVEIVPLELDRLVDAAFEQIRVYAKADAVVSLRLLRAMRDLGISIPDPSLRKFLAARGDRIYAGCAERLPEEELGELQARLEVLREAAGG